MADLLWLIPLALSFGFGYCVGEWVEERRRDDEWWAARGESSMRVWRKTQREETKR